MAAATAGCTLAHYHLEEPLGFGAMGVVFLAQDTHLCRKVAVKVLPGDRLDRQARRRLREEALTLSRLNHPNVASVFDFGSHGDIDYLVMEFVPGRTLDALLKDGPLETEAVASLGGQLGRGLAAAHASGIVHRDIKPGNLRVTPDGLLKILDFGVATFGGPINSSTGTTVAFDAIPGLTGTIQYMPPERLRGMPAGPRADIFSAGAVLYEMACGRAPFDDPQPVRLIESILCGRLDRPSRINPRMDRELESIILRALDRDAERRFARAVDLAEALETLLICKPVSRRGSSGALSRWVTMVASSLLV